MKRLPFLTAVLSGAAIPAVTIPALGDQQITVLVSGTPVEFDQPAVRRGGRVYVPLRRVFERLGASVVYADGHIDATQGRRRIGLTIGSIDALVDGRQQALDAPPFTIAGRTFVPLRFISQALGATVDYDASAHTVSVLPASGRFASV